VSAPRVVAVVQARFGSSRLPGKAMRVLAGRPMLAHVLERAAAVEGVSTIVLATTVRECDDALAALALASGVPCFRGDEADVLTRFELLAQLHRADVIVRLTGDCPLIDPAVCAAVLAEFAEPPQADFASNDTTSSGYPDGTDCEVIGRDALREAWRNTRIQSDREHVTPWIRRHKTCRTVRYAGPDDLRRVKLSVDTEEDFARVSKIFAKLKPGETSLAATLRAAGVALGNGRTPGRI